MMTTLDLCSPPSHLQPKNNYVCMFVYLYVTLCELGLEKKLFVSCNSPEKNRVGRPVKK